jgi:hypothetical protein
MTPEDWRGLAAEMRELRDAASVWAEAVREDDETKFADQLDRLAGMADGLAELAAQRAQ